MYTVWPFEYLKQKQKYLRKKNEKAQIKRHRQRQIKTKTFSYGNKKSTEYPFIEDISKQSTYYKRK